MTNRVNLILDSRHYAGIEAHVFHLSCLLKRKGVQVKIILLADYGRHPLKDKLSEWDIEVETIKTGFTGLLRVFLESNKQDVFHTHGYKAGILCRGIGLVCRRKIVSTYHCGDRGTGKMAVLTWLDKITQCLSHNIAVSDEINHWLGNSAIVMSNFVNPEPPVIRHHSLDVHVAFIGRLSIEKGPDRFIRLAKHFQKNQHLKFKLFGSGPLQEALLANATDNTEFMGFTADLNEHWSSIDVVVITSRAEGMPMVAIEAMMRGVAVIATPCGAMPRLLGDNQRGWLTASHSDQDIAHGVSNWLATKTIARAKMLNHAREYVLHQCTGESQWPELEKLYRSKLFEQVSIDIKSKDC